MVADLNPDGTDITQKDAENFLQIINLAGTIIWNGSMGIVGGKSADLPTEEGTKKDNRRYFKNRGLYRSWRRRYT